MNKKILISLLLIILVLKLPITSQAAVDSAPFVTTENLETKLTSYVTKALYEPTIAVLKNSIDTINSLITKIEENITNLNSKIDSLKDRISVIENNPTGESKSIKVYDSNNQYVGIFAGLEYNYLVFLEKINKFVNIHPRTLTYFPVDVYYSNGDCNDSFIFVFTNSIDPNQIYKIGDKWFYGSSNPDDIITHVYRKESDGTCIDLGASSSNYIKMIESTDFIIPDNLQPPLQLRYEQI